MKDEELIAKVVAAGLDPSHEAIVYLREYNAGTIPADAFREGRDAEDIASAKRLKLRDLGEILEFAREGRIDFASYVAVEDRHTKADGSEIQLVIRRA